MADAAADDRSRTLRLARPRARRSCCSGRLVLGPLLAPRARRTWATCSASCTSTSPRPGTRMLALTFAFVCALVVPAARRLAVGRAAGGGGGGRASCCRRSCACRARSGPSRPGASGGTGTRASPRPRSWSSPSPASSPCAASSTIPVKRAVWSAVATIIAYVDVPIVYFSVRWWNSLHQMQSRPETVSRAFHWPLRINAFGMLFLMSGLIALRARLAGPAARGASWRRRCPSAAAAPLAGAEARDERHGRHRGRLGVRAARPTP